MKPAKRYLALGLLGLSASAAAAGDPGATVSVPLATIAAGGASDASWTSGERAQAPEPALAPQPSGWEFSAGPYLWMAGMKGDVGVVPQIEPVGIDLSFGDIVSHLKFALMGSAEARKGRFVATGDFMFLNLGTSENIDIREAGFLEAELKEKTFFATATAGYRVVDKDRFSVDMLAGGRINYAKTDLDLEGPQRSFSGAKSKTWFDPIIAVRFRAALAERWSLQTYGDVGGFGVGSDHTWQLHGVVAYDVSNRWSLSGGWRHLKVDYENNGFVFDASMDGPILGAVYRF